MANQTKGGTAAPQTITFTVPDDPKAARTLLILGGDEAQARKILAETAAEYRKLANAASETRAFHDSMLGMRQTLRGDLASVNPLRKPKGTGEAADTAADDDEAETEAPPAETPTA